MKMRLAAILFILITSLSNVGQCNQDTQNSTTKRWDAYFKRKLFDPPAGFVIEALNFLPKGPKGKVALDLGSGVGHETALLLNRGYRVIAVDNQDSSFKYMNRQPEIKKFQNQLVTIVSSFENLDFAKIPSADLVVASFSLPFVSKQDFDKVWAEVVDKLKPGGYFIGNLFDPEFTFFDQKFRPHMSFHTKDQARTLFINDFNIISFKEVKVPSLKKGTSNHYYVILARKLAPPHYIKSN